MKITKIKIENFKKITGDFTVERINTLIGKNGSGKTSFLQAVRFALTGIVPGGAIQYGKDYLSVAVTLADGDEFKRTVYAEPVTMINGIIVSEDQFCQALMAYYNAGDQAVFENGNACFADPKKGSGNIYPFLMDGKCSIRMTVGGKCLLARIGNDLFFRRVASATDICVNGKNTTKKAFDSFLLSKGITDLKAIDLITSSDVSNTLSPDEFGKKLMTMLHAAVSFSDICTEAGLTPEQVDIIRPVLPDQVQIHSLATAYQTLFDSRTVTNRDLNTANRKSVFNGVMPTLSEDQINQELKNIADCKNAVAAAMAEKKNYDAMVSFRQQTINHISNLEKELESSINKYGVLTIDPNEAERLQAEISNKMVVMETQQRIYSSACEANKPLQRFLDNLSTSVCPLCPTLVCNTDKNACADDLKKTMMLNYNNAMDAKKTYKAVREEYNNLLAQQKGLQEKGRICSEQQMLRNTIEQQKQSVPVLPPAPAPIPSYTGMEDRERELLNMLKEHALYAEALRNQTWAIKLKEQADALTEMLAMMNPKNGRIAQIIMSRILDPIKTRCNACAKSMFTDSEVDFCFKESGLNILYKPNAGKPFTEIGNLSAGERLRLTYILMDFMSSLSNIRLIVFDNIEAFDSVTLTAFYDMIKNSPMDCIFAAGVDHEDLKKALPNTIIL